MARDLSGGMKRRLSLAATLVHNPELLFLDEPTARIDPLLRRKFWDYFKGLQAEGHTLFITTQYVGEAAFCDLVATAVLASSTMTSISWSLTIFTFPRTMGIEGKLAKATQCRLPC